MKENKTVENVTATIGAVLWAVQGVPQIWKSYRTKSTKGLSPHLMITWSLSSLFFATYTVPRHLSIPMTIQPHISFIFFSISWAQCLYHTNVEFPSSDSHDSEEGRKDPRIIRKTLICLGVWLVCCGAFEGISVQLLWIGKRSGTEIPMTVYCYTSSALSVIGLLPQYYEIFKLGQVRGVSWGFVAIDIIGAIFGMISLFFRAKFDIAAFVVYALTAAMMTLIVVLALILNPRATKRRRLDQSSTIVIPSAVNTTVTPSTFVDVPLHEKNENDSHEPGYPEPVTRPNGAMNPELGNQAESPMTQVHEADSLHHLAYISPAKP